MMKTFLVAAALAISSPSSTWGFIPATTNHAPINTELYSDDGGPGRLRTFGGPSTKKGFTNSSTSATTANVVAHATTKPGFSSAIPTVSNGPYNGNTNVHIGGSNTHPGFAPIMSVTGEASGSSSVNGITAHASTKAGFAPVMNASGMAGGSCASALPGSPSASAAAPDAPKKSYGIGSGLKKAPSTVGAAGDYFASLS